MKISVITTTYNSALTLRDTIESILSQRFHHIEYIVVDGGSTDGTLDIIRQYEPRFAGRLRWVSEADNGLYDAMNKGFALATGDVIGILNSDDVLYDSQVLSSVAQAFHDHTVDCVFGDLLYVHPADLNKVVREWKGSPYQPGGFVKGWHPAHPTFYVRRKFFEQYGGFDLTLDISADFEMMLRYLAIHKLRSRYIPRYMVKMRMGGVSNGSLTNIIKGNRNIVRAFRKNGIQVSPFYIPRRLTGKVFTMIKLKFKHYALQRK